MPSSDKRRSYMYRAAHASTGDAAARAVLAVLRPSLVKVAMLPVRRRALSAVPDLLPALEEVRMSRGLPPRWPAMTFRRLKLDPALDGEWGVVNSLMSGPTFLLGYGRAEVRLFSASTTGMALSLTDAEYADLRKLLVERGIDPEVVVKNRFPEPTRGWRLIISAVGLLAAALAMVLVVHHSVVLFVWAALFFLFFVRAVVKSTRLWLTDRRST